MICVGRERDDSFHASFETDFLHWKRFYALGCTGHVDNLPTIDEIRLLILDHLSLLLFCTGTFTLRIMN